MKVWHTGIDWAQSYSTFRLPCFQIAGQLGGCLSLSGRYRQSVYCRLGKTAECSIYCSCREIAECASAAHRPRTQDFHGQSETDHSLGHTHAAGEQSFMYKERKYRCCIWASCPYVEDSQLQQNICIYTSFLSKRATFFLQQLPACTPISWLYARYRLQDSSIISDNMFCRELLVFYCQM